MKKKVFMIVLSVLTVAACTKDRRPQPAMGWTAQDRVDQICGQYALVQGEWSGKDMDLNGDGLIMPFLEELQGGTWMGLQTTSRSATITPATRLDTPTDIAVTVYYGDLFPSGVGGYSLDRISFHYTIDKAGDIQFHTNGIFIRSFNDETHYKFENVQVRFISDYLEISADTDYYDYASGALISGRETFRYECISTKQKP